MNFQFWTVLADGTQVCLKTVSLFSAPVEAIRCGGRVLWGINPGSQVRFAITLSIL